MERSAMKHFSDNNDLSGCSGRGVANQGGGLHDGPLRMLNGRVAIQGGVYMTDLSGCSIFFIDGKLGSN